MSKLAKEWIQRNFSVKQQLEPLERCLSDGYVLVSMCRQQGLVDEMEFEEAVNTPDPEAATINLKILAKALRKVNIKLTKSDVAAIVSEQSGFAPSLVMEMKRSFEEGGKNKRVRTPEYKKAINTLRPHEYVREGKKDPLSPRSKFLETTALTNPNISMYREIDPTCQFNEYEVFRYQVDEKEDEKERMAFTESLAIRDGKYRAQVARDKETIRIHEEKTQSLKKNWQSTQKVKRDRRIRDTQFELAVGTHRELKKLDVDMKHTSEQIQGIENFEHTLKRSGLGGTDDSRPLAVSYEDAESYLTRLEELTIQKLPTKEETNDFVLSLKTRTAESRLSRLEKARRKRRMLVEQLAAQKAAAEMDNQVETGDENVEDDKKEQAREQEAAKANRDMKLTTEAREAHSQLMEVAEDKLRVFLESHRLLTDDAGLRTKRYQEVVTAQQERKLAKSSANTDFCRTLVLELVKQTLVRTVGEDLVSAPSSGHDGRDADLARIIIEDVRALVDEEVHGQGSGSGNASRRLKAFLGDMVGLEAWSAYAGLASHVGCRRIVREMIESSPLLTRDQDLGLQSPELMEKDEEEPRTGEESEAECNLEATDDSAERNTEKEILSEPSTVGLELGATQKPPQPEPPGVAAPMMRTKVEPSQSLVASVQEVCEAVLLGTDDLNFPHIKPSEQECATLTSGRVKAPYIVLVLGQGNDASLTTWETGVKLLGGKASDMIEVWDVVHALEAAEMMKPMLILEGKAKSPEVKMEQLATVFMREKRKDQLEGESLLPSDLGEKQVDPKCLSVITDLVSSFDLWSKFETLASTDGGKDQTTVGDIGFDDTYLFSILGQILWVREYLRQEWMSSGEDGRCSLSTFLLVTRSFGRSTDDGRSAAVFDWFLKGGTRDNIPDTEVQLKAVTTASFGKYEPGRKPGKPGKGDPEVPSSSAVSALLWIKSNYTSRDLFSEEPKTYSCSPSSNKWQAAMNMYEFLRNAEGGGSYDPLAAERDIIEFASSHPEMLSVFARKENTSWDCQFQEKGVEVVDVTGDFMYLELLSAVMSSLLESRASVPVEPSESESEPQAQFHLNLSQSICTKALEKRSVLAPAQICSLRHLLGERRLDLAVVYETLEGLYSISNRSVLLEGGLFVATSESLRKLLDKMRRDEASLIAGFKASDVRWAWLVGQFENSLKFDANSVKTAACDLQCAIGDTLDERHMRWLEGVAVFEEVATEDTRNAICQLFEILGVLAQTSKSLYNQHAASLRQFVSVLTSAGYDSFPFSLSSKTMKGGRMNLQRKRDELRAAALSCMKYVTNWGHDALEEVASHWVSIAAQELPQDAADSSVVLQEALTELLFNTLDRSLCIVLAFRDALERVSLKCLELGKSLRQSTLIRHNYEHEYLKRWGKDLIQSSSSASFVSEPNSLTGYGINVMRSISQGSSQSNSQLPSFTPSIDVKDDGIVWKDGCGMLELGEMTLNVDTIKEFALEMVSSLSSDPNASFVDFVKYSVQRLEERDYDISYPWKHSEKISTFLRKVIGDSELYSRGRQHEHCCTLVVHLVLGILPQVFSDRTIKFLLNEAKNLLPEKQSDDEESNDDNDQDVVVGEELFMKKVSAAPHLCEEYGVENFNMYFGALQALAICATKNEGIIRISDFLPLVCRSVVMPLMVSFESRLVHRSSGLDEGAEGGMEESTSRPIVLRPGLAKMGILARYLRRPSSSDHLLEELNACRGLPLDARQVTSRFGPVEEEALRKTKCARVRAEVTEASKSIRKVEGTGDESQSQRQGLQACQYQTFQNDVVFLSELPPLLDSQTMGNHDSCDILFQES